MRDLSHLKAGDSVAYVYHKEPKIVEIDRVTPSGRILVGTRYFGPRGTLLGGSGMDKYFHHIEEVTPAILERIERVELLESFRRTNFGALSIDCLRAINQTIKNEKAKS